MKFFQNTNTNKKAILTLKRLLKMVGYDPNKVNLSTTEQMYVSVATSVVTRLLIQPFDVVKIRFQVLYIFYI